ncbi:hypothetical protein E2C01_030138 [Portunus trituberculatus]|uniref:Uncharacterized protein n=1 Tax=Portunus trituberculatus TaxID=210409 RepID=A0A5B7ERA6_PORTR|nr:hypothetical protein [Portunus trituberculatus]
MNARKETHHGIWHCHSKDIDLPVFLRSVSGEAGGWAGMAGAGLCCSLLRLNLAIHKAFSSGICSLSSINFHSIINTETPESHNVRCCSYKVSVPLHKMAEEEAVSLS